MINNPFSFRFQFTFQVSRENLNQMINKNELSRIREFHFCDSKSIVFLTPRARKMVTGYFKIRNFPDSAWWYGNAIKSRRKSLKYRRQFTKLVKLRLHSVEIYCSRLNKSYLNTYEIFLLLTPEIDFSGCMFFWNTISE